MGYSLMVDHEKKMKRKISNRESSKRSRMKRDQHMKDLSDKLFYFMKKRDEMLPKMKGIAQEYAAMEVENMVLRSQKQELEKRLEYAKSVCGWCEGDGYGSMSSMGGFQEPWLRPWDQYQISNSISLMPSTGNFQF
ncbi:bZIP transcription factor 44-like [Bidens hawaiensis]|uniref:bZIP transcription factor 44-like n=1 Tax=Bidens hawaiensis TaxID=980011 RepID=UPI00404ADDDF